ncbi:MAG: hypothetical protein HZB26_21870 [Candidatus Hydrogenedentes bacterium]|nr:hypothetical protein [Candidatus Hydrogenedentota bacterium]
MFTVTIAVLLAAAGQTPPVAASVRLIPEFSAKEFREPDAALWPAYFWLWNAPLDAAVLRAQLQDMASHDARSVCMLPMPHGFRPDSTNNSLDPDYLTPEYFARVREVVDEAARLGMTWWMYDEGGWPSGQALGKVVEGHPELTRRTITREPIATDKPYVVPADALAAVVDGAEPKVIPPGGTWTPSAPGETASVYRATAGRAVDLLNPAATARFVELTHDGYAHALGEHIGKTVRFSFTDEPVAGMPQAPKSVPWFPGLEQRYQDRCGRAFLSDLPRLFSEASTTIPVDTARARVALYDEVTQRFADSYFERLKDWDREHGMASAGHLGGEDETFGAVKHGFGHLLRQLRQFDVPGVDLIWRQLFPGRENQSNFPIAAASAAHQNGTRFAFSESFCVYGNGLTPAQMKWLVDYQYIRGINLLVVGCYPLSTQDHHMTGERPHFGAMNPLWDHLTGFHGYVARLGYALSVGRPMVRTALYYPARDLWAWGLSATDAADSYEAVGHELMARQCPYDLIDDDTLSAAKVDGASLAAGAMRYDTLVCEDVKWMHPDARRRVEEYVAAGGRVLCVGHGPGADGVAAEMRPAPTAIGSAVEIAQRATQLVTITPSNRDLRVAARETDNERIVLLFNVGSGAYSGSIQAMAASVSELNLMTGGATRLEVVDGRVAVQLDPGETRAFIFSAQPAAEARSPLIARDAVTIDPAEIRAVAGRQTVVGEHDFENTKRTFENVPFSQSSVWKSWLTEDYSGEVDYQFVLNVPEEWAGAALQLETGPIEYAATVYVDGKKAGYVLWAPWQVTLPPCVAGPHTITLCVANTLANELTSERVTQAWAQKSGPGWPSPYHKRAIEFERESRGGGIAGPIRVTRMTTP